MGKNVLILNGNPKPDSFCRSLALQYLAGAQEAGHAVRLVHIADFQKPGGRGAVAQDISAQADLLWAEHIVFIYPNWWGTVPAALKGWLDTVLTAGFAFRFDMATNRLEGLLEGRTARLVVTMDTPKWIYRLLFSNGGITIMRRAVLGFCGVKPVRVSTFGPMYKSDPPVREKWLVQIRELGRQAA
ncbi:NAD(P)H-dependent oxidoreductase [Chitiniphilus purpureus]|uniref:NAD(P)H-dependent oxidoreductase n=1 Tax=Chitiniphilus purpureus TaxID=2981137 RepID=A0ABY6DS07_9NEIS|nr:NAD(P)H-dependent oxidoreductase [Chitiniphilus sp. CD1]UXY17146.1 NAD(P)H-dependent oxidoreductase [Chitiniphilus sp. CD1]